MSDWACFVQEVSWFVEPGTWVAVGEPLPWARKPIAALPELSALLSSATLTPVSVAGQDYELLAWGLPDRRRGWLCHPPRGTDASSPMPAVHEAFGEVCGGIIERFGEPTTWWMNQNEILTPDATRVRVAEVLDSYASIWNDDGLKIPINPDEYYVVAVEANGNLTLAHRADGQLLVFAPDHAFTGVTPLAGCPPYSLLTIDDAPDLATWIEVCAAAWRQA